MEQQDKHRYRDTRDRWSYAHDKVLKESKEKDEKRETVQR